MFIWLTPFPLNCPRGLCMTSKDCFINHVDLSKGRRVAKYPYYYISRKCSTYSKNCSRGLWMFPNTVRRTIRTNFGWTGISPSECEKNRSSQHKKMVPIHDRTLESDEQLHAYTKMTLIKVREIYINPIRFSATLIIFRVDSLWKKFFASKNFINCV